jgi:hypothetical protein
MFCKIAWQREFFDKVLCPGFRLKEYRRHRENILCEREKIRLPETQALCETVDQRTKTLQDEIDGLSDKNDELRVKLRRLSAKYEREIQHNSDRQNRIRRQQRRYTTILLGHVNELDDDRAFAQDTVSRAAKFVMPCPLAECKGFLDENYLCGVCSGKVCRRCHVSCNDNAPSSSSSSEEDKHRCDPDAVASVQHLRKATKGCPGCGARISKIDGCDQMWCIGCHTAFSWNTGQKVSEHGVIHNPHFYQWKRNNGGLAPGRVDANGCPVGRESLSRAVQNVRRLTGVQASHVLDDIHREMRHIENVELRRDHEANMVDPTRDLRVKYLHGELTETQWKVQLQRVEKRRLKRAENEAVYQMYATTVNDLFRKIGSAESLIQLDESHKEMVSLMTYVRENLRNICQRYGHGNGYVEYANWGDWLTYAPYFSVPSNMPGTVSNS